MKIQTYIAGITFNDRQLYVKKHNVGDKLFLVREHDNQYDFNAIKIIDNECNQLGFLPKDLSARLAPEIDAGAEFDIIICGIKAINNSKDLGVEILVEQKRTSIPVSDNYDNDDYFYASEFPDMEAYESWYESSDF